MPAPERLQPDHRPWMGGTPGRHGSSRLPVRPAGQLRVSNAERQAVIDELTRHTTDGRLTLDEFEDRVGEAHAALVGDDLGHALRELPALESERPHRHDRRPRFERRRRRIGSRRLAVAAVLAVLAVVNGWFLLFVPAVWFAVHAVGPARHYGCRRQPDWD
ncbi:MAG TPA: DUF1707 domain-containing protein [Acidimicrobiales bacterium]